MTHRIRGENRFMKIHISIWFKSLLFTIFTLILSYVIIEYTDLPIGFRIWFPIVLPICFEVINIIMVCVTRTKILSKIIMISVLPSTWYLVFVLFVGYAIFIAPTDGFYISFG